MASGFKDKAAQRATEVSTPELNGQSDRHDVPQAPTMTLADWLESKESLFALAAASEELGRHLVRDAITCLRTTRNLDKVEPFSLLGGVMTCAQLRLRPVNGRAWLLPFWDKETSTHRATFVIGYRGLIDLAFRSGMVRSVVARPVCEGEVFDVDYGTGLVVHKPVKRGRRGAAYGYYAMIEYVTGGRYPYYMTREDVEHHRDQHATRDRHGNIVGAWLTDFDAMARKTPLRLVLGDAPADPSAQPLATALAVDGRLRVDITPDADPSTVSEFVPGQVASIEAADADGTPPPDSTG